jgi:uncharacterized protein (TIGR00106 family)
MAEFSIYPLDKGDSLSPYVARAVKIVKESGLAYNFGPMGTTVEGDWDQVSKVLEDCFRDLEKDCERISLTVRMDYRKEGGSRMEQKVSSVREKLD